MFEYLRQASFKGVTFDFQDVEDTLDKSLARYDYPYKDDPDVEDMGTGREVKLKAFFLNENYEAHRDFLAMLKEPGPGELIHPIYGTLQAVMTTCTVRHDDRDRTAEIDVSFLVVEHIPVVTAMPTLKSRSAEIAALDTEIETETLNLLAQDFKSRGIPEDAPVTDIGNPGYLSKLTGLTASVRNELGVVSEFVGKAAGFITPTIAELRLIASDATDIASLPGTVLGTVTTAVNSVAGSAVNLTSMPGRFMAGLDNGFSSMEAVFGSFGGNTALGSSYRTRKASAKVTAASLELRADEAAEKGEGLSLRDYGQEDASVTRTEVMSIDEIDGIVSDARRSVNEAISEVRAAFGDRGYALELKLKAQAALLHDMADEIRLRRPQIIDYTLPNETSLHLLCFKLYGDHTRASEILRLNKVKDPNFIMAGETLKVYAA